MIGITVMDQIPTVIYLACGKKNTNRWWIFHLATFDSWRVNPEWPWDEITPARLETYHFSDVFFANYNWFLGISHDIPIFHPHFSWYNMVPGT